MSIQEQIKEVVTTHRVVLFMKGTKQFRNAASLRAPYKFCKRPVAMILSP